MISSKNLLPSGIKSLNPIQNYPHILEPFSCILKTFAMIILFSPNSLISFRIYSIPKLSKYFNIHYSYTKLLNEFSLIYTHQDLIRMSDPLV